MLCLVKSSNYIPDASFNEEFLLHSSFIISGYSEDFVVVVVLHSWFYLFKLG